MIGLVLFDTLNSRTLKQLSNNSMSPTNPTSMSTSMTPMMNNIWMVSLSIILDIHDSPPIVAISQIADMLYPPIRKSNRVFTLYITSLIPRPYFTKVCIILVIMHSILEVERIRTVIISLAMTSSNMSSTSNKSSTSNTSGFARGQTNNRDSNTKQNLHVCPRII